MSLFRSLTIQALFLLWIPASGVAGCGSSDSKPEPDAGPDPGADSGAYDGPERTLELVGEPSLQLAFGQVAELAFEYRLTDGTPAVDPVSFAIEGSGGDSSLTAVTAVPDPDGRVTTELRAGTVGAASFRVRASAAEAASAYVEVSVGDAGFGNLSVTASYRGDRSMWGVELRLYTALACGELDARNPPVADRTVHVGGPTDDGRWSGVFASLAVGPTYTVLAMGVGKGGGVVASGCVPGVAVAAEPAPPVEVAVTLQDQPFGAVGRFAVSSELELHDALSGRVDAWLEPARDLLAEGTETFLLDEVSAYLSQNVPEDAGSPFESLRPDLEVSLGERLAARDADASSVLLELTADLEASLSAPTLHSVLLLDELAQADDPARGLRFSHEAASIDVPLVVAGRAAGVHEVTFSQAGLVSLSSGAATTSTEELTLASHTLPFRVGSLAAAVLRDAIVAEWGDASLQEHLADALDCADVGAWLDEQAGGACDALCYQAACEQAAEHLATEIDGALRAGDADYDELTLEGHAQLADADGDAATDTLNGGVWTASLQGERQADVTASFSGERDDIE